MYFFFCLIYLFIYWLARGGVPIPKKTNQDYSRYFKSIQTTYYTTCMFFLFTLFLDIVKEVPGVGELMAAVFLVSTSISINKWYISIFFLMFGINYYYIFFAT